MSDFFTRALKVQPYVLTENNHSYTASAITNALDQAISKGRLVVSRNIQVPVPGQPIGPVEVLAIVNSYERFREPNLISINMVKHDSTDAKMFFDQFVSLYELQMCGIITDQQYRRSMCRDTPGIMEVTGFDLSYLTFMPRKQVIIE